MAHALPSSCTLLRKGLRGSFREDHSVDENKLGLECLLRGLNYLGVPSHDLPSRKQIPVINILKGCNRTGSV